MFYHFETLQCLIIGLAKRIRKEQNAEGNQLSSVDFRLRVPKVLCKIGTKITITRRAAIETDIQAKKHKAPVQHISPMAVVSQTICEKCGVALRYKHN